MAMTAFEPYADAVYGWAYRLMGRHHDALDVVQDVFLRWSKQCARQIPEAPRGWLRRVTVNRALDLIRQRRANRDVRSVALEGADDPQGLAAGDREVLRDDVVSALETLSARQRSVLVAKVYDELTFAEIAQELGIAIPSVKTHYVRAVSTLRDCLNVRWKDG